MSIDVERAPEPLGRAEIDAFARDNFRTIEKICGKLDGAMYDDPHAAIVVAIRLLAQTVALLHDDRRLGDP